MFRFEVVEVVEVAYFDPTRTLTPKWTGWMVDAYPNGAVADRDRLWPKFLGNKHSKK